MKAVRAIVRSDAFRQLICWLGAGYIRLVHFTGRWRVVGGEIPAEYWNAGKPFILCFWHGRLLMMPYVWDRSRSSHMLISQHRDGQLIARTIGHFGFETIVGSSSHGGARALRSMVKALAAGDCVGITPDGPRGPRMRADNGIVTVARLSGVPVIPVAYSINRGQLLGTWDRFLIAWPFSRGVIVWGEPIHLARDADEATAELIRQRIENNLNAITAEADRLCGRRPIEPTPNIATEIPEEEPAA